MTRLSTTIVFTDPDYTENCETNIEIEIKGDKYDITYEHTYKNPSNGETSPCETLEDVRMPNPFAYRDRLKGHFEGEIITKNKMTESMIEFLLMPNNELEAHIEKNTDPIHYKRQVLYNISNLWI